MRRTQKQLQEEIEKFKVYQKDDRWYGYRECPDCKREIEHEAQESYLVLRNIRNSLNSFCLSCGKKGERNNFFGKHHSEKSKAQNSKSRMGQCCGNNNAMANPVHRKSVSDALKIKYSSGELDFQKKIQREYIIKNIEAGKMRTAPVSVAEKEIKEKLETDGLTVESQFRIGTLKYDLLIKEKNILIEYNGDYWHCNPLKYSPEYFHVKKQLTAQQIWGQDLIKKELAEKSGYKLFIIWEQDYMFNKSESIENLKQKINE